MNIVIGAAPIFERSCGDYVISDDVERFDTNVMHDLLKQKGGLASGRSWATTSVAVANSVVLGVYAPDGSMVGGARIITDRATLGWLTDICLQTAHRNDNLCKALITVACEHPAVATIERFVLVTTDLDNPNESFLLSGFAPLSQPECWIELRSEAHDAPLSVGSNKLSGVETSYGTPPNTEMSHTSPGDTSLGDTSPGDTSLGNTSPGDTSPDDPSSWPHKYVSWHREGLADPRTAPVSQIAVALLEIVKVEGPITIDRACKLYIRGAGSTKLTQRVRIPLEQALNRLVLRGLIETDEFDFADSPQKVLRPLGAHTVIVRELGERLLYEVPLNEIAMLMRLIRRELTGRYSGPAAHAMANVIRQAAHRRASPERLKRSVLDTYGLVRMTQRADQYLSTALALLEQFDQSEQQKPDTSNQNEAANSG